MSLLIASAPPTDPPITLPPGKSLSECISSVPKPGCTTRSEADGHQLAVLGVIMTAVIFIGWRVARGVRRRPGAVPAPPPAAPSEPPVPSER